MTISSTTVKNSYSGNGSTTAFAYTFKIFANTDLQVIIRSSTGTETVKTLTTHYTVSGVGDASGGNVTFTSGNTPASGETVVIRRAVPQTQAIDYIANDPFPAESHEEGLDRATMTTQQVQEELDRSLKLSRTNTMTSTEFTVGASDRANKVLAFDSSGEISVTQELGTFKGTDATVTTAAYVQRDIIKSTTAAQLNNVYICVADSVVGDSLTDTDHFQLLVDAVSAATSATNAATSATASASSATSSASSASSASTQASNASSSATAAASSATAAAASATDAANSADAFDDIYLGSKSSDPSTDNDGDALAAGMLYFNTTSDLLRVYTGSAWQNAAVDTTGFITVGGVETLTNKTLTSPKIGTALLDTNGNELAKVTATSSAVNEFTVANAATGNSPTLSATGGDSNIDLTIGPKGTGKIIAKSGGTNPGSIQLNCENNTHGIQLMSPAHSAGQSYTLKFPTSNVTADKFLKVDSISGSGATATGQLSFADVSGGISWQSTVVTGATHTASAGQGIWIDTTSNANTLTLPSSPSVGDEVIFSDFARKWGTNAVTLSLNGSKFQGNTSPAPVYDTDGETVHIVYSGSTQGWIPINDGAVALETPQSYTAQYLVIAGGGGSAMVYGGGGGAGGYRNSFGSETSGRGSSTETALTIVPGTQYTITIGAGGSGATNYSGSASEKRGQTGSDSSISGSGITTVTSAGGGFGNANLADGGNGGCGGGAGSSGANGNGTANQGYDGGDASTNGNGYAGGGGGGAGAVGGDSQGNSTTGGAGGAGLASSITGSSVTRGGGGGGGSPGVGTVGAAGSGGGGTNGGNGTANTGGGGGASKVSSGGLGVAAGSGGSGVVILSVPDASYSGTTTGSPTVATGVSGQTVITFTGSGTYTA